MALGLLGCSTGFAGKCQCVSLETTLAFLGHQTGLGGPQCWAWWCPGVRAVPSPGQGSEHLCGSPWDGDPVPHAPNFSESPKLVETTSSPIPEQDLGAGGILIYVTRGQRGGQP